MLDLRECPDLAELPPSLARMTHLRWLRLGGAGLAVLCPLPDSLRGLQHLVLVLKEAQEVGPCKDAPTYARAPCCSAITGSCHNSTQDDFAGA